MAETHRVSEFDSPPLWPLRSSQPDGSVDLPGVYADLVTALGFKPSVASEKEPGGFDSHPLPFFVVIGGQRWTIVVNAPVFQGRFLFGLFTTR